MVKRVRSSAKLPKRAYSNDAGVDVYYCPSEGERDLVSIEPGCNAKLPTGLSVQIPHSFMLEVKNKSGLAAKHSVVVGACVVDHGYSGEVFVDLHNIGRETYTVSSGQKIAQFVLIPVFTGEVMEITESEPYDGTSERGSGGFGSTGLD